MESTEWTLAYRRPKANRFARIPDLHLTWDQSTDLGRYCAWRHPELQVWTTTTREAEVSGRVCPDDVGNILTDSGRRVVLVDTGNLVDLLPELNRRWSADRAGCLFEGSSTRSADELNMLVVELAADNGWPATDKATREHLHELSERLWRIESHSGVLWFEDPDDSDAIADAARDAADWLNEHIAPEGYVFEFDDGFYLRADVDE